MTFPARLTELLEKATKGPFIVGSMEAPDGHAMSWHGNWYVDSEAPRVNGERYGDPKADAQLHKLFLDHAEALRDLVAAAEKLKLALDAKIVMEGRNGVHKKLDDHLAWRQNDELAQRMAEEALALYSEALAKLEEQ